MSSLTLENGNLVVRTKYDQGFVAALKATIPSTSRTFDKEAKVWIVEPTYGDQVAKLISQFFGELVLAPMIKTVKPVNELRVIEVRYVGMTKDRGTGERSAFGLDGCGEWSVIFPEDVLRAWFCDTQTSRPSSGSLYALLGISTLAQPDEIKSAYRRMAKQWHPDVCKEPDAAEVFKKIVSAYELLSNEIKRARYDAGLALEASLKNRPAPADYSAMFRSPLRCGYILAEGIFQLNRFVVNKILAWDDITNEKGQTLVTSWPLGATKPVEVWA